MKRSKRVHGKTAYEILDLPNCPISLPYARSMTQARIDFENREEAILEWYKRHVNTKKAISFGVVI